jgi:hypothetical protein
MVAPKEILDLIAGSGNNFHARVARWFADNGWHVIISPYYLDQSQGKAREIDLIAEKLWTVLDSFGRPKDHVAVRLFIECKFVALDAVFWCADKDREAALELVCATHPFQRNNSYTEEHHYLAQSPRVAKLFATLNSKIVENEPFYKALNQALSALVSMRGQVLTEPTIRKRNRAPVTILEVPVVVCSSFDKLYSVDFFSDSQPEPITENFQLEVRYAYAGADSQRRNEYFLLDFVAFDKLRQFVNAVDASAGAAAILASD